jgi:hypothetical protein
MFDVKLDVLVQSDQFIRNMQIVEDIYKDEYSCSISCLIMLRNQKNLYQLSRIVDRRMLMNIHVRRQDACCCQIKTIDRNYAK